MAIYLLVKEHIDTGLKYLCKHVASSFFDCEKYKMTGVPKTENHKQNMRGKRPHVNQTGTKNNNAKSITTPFGIFGSISEAANCLEKYTYRMIWYKLHNDIEWRYLKSL